MMHFKKRFFIAIFAGIFAHLVGLFYLNHHEIHLTPMARQGVLELTFEENDTSQKPFEEIDRDEVIHAFFSQIAPESSTIESLTSTPDPIDMPLEEMNDRLLAEEENLEQPLELSSNSDPSSLISDSDLDLDFSELNLEETTSGVLVAEELIDTLEDHGTALGNTTETLLEPTDINLELSQTPSANIHQGLALLESTAWQELPSEAWEENLIASLETENSNFTRFFRGTETQANSDTFQAHVQYYPREDKGDYIFKISLSPKKGKHFKRIRQNIFFLVDRSNSIDRSIFYKTRDTLQQTLPLLHPDDSFNILVFDDEVNPFSTGPVKASEENIQEAQKFLSTLKHGGLFAATDLYRSLDEIIPQEISPYEANTAILLSDGDTFLSLEKQRQTIGKWTEDNQGKVSLFSFAIGKKNNLPLLDAISSFNRGVLVHSPSINTLPYVLQNFLQSIRYPLGKDFIVTSIPSKEHMQITLYPRNKRLPVFYENIPYTIYGRTSHLEDFSLFLQGKHYKSWLDIQIPISFSDAQKVDIALEKQYTLQKVYDYYEQFLETGSMYPLMQAKDLLTPFGIETAFGIR